MSCSRLEDEDMLADLGGTLDAHVEQCQDCSERLRGYRQLAGLIADGVTSHHAPPEWKQRTLARVYTAPRVRRRRVTLLSTFAAAAAAGAILFLLRHQDMPPDGPVAPLGTPELAIQVVGGDGWRGEAHLGEAVRAHARLAGASYFEIRVYRSARVLLVRCPSAGPSVCLEPNGSLLVWKVPSVGTYQVLLLVSQQPIAAPRGSLDDDVAVATGAGARAIDVETIHVH